MKGNSLVFVAVVNLATLIHLGQSTVYLAKQSGNEELYSFADIVRASMGDQRLPLDECKHNNISAGVYDTYRGCYSSMC